MMLRGVPQARLTRVALSYRSVVNWLFPRLTFNDDNSDYQDKPSMGQLAHYLLALRANCELVEGRKGDRLVSQLKRFLEDEKKAIGEGDVVCRVLGGGAHQIVFCGEASKSELWVFSSGFFPTPHSACVTIHLEAWACCSCHP